MKIDPRVEPFRFRMGQFASSPSELQGAFFIPGPCSRELIVIASNGSAEHEILWEHVSVCVKRHTPTWAEMDFIKRLFWDDEETVMQLHPPRSRWINNMPNCLHMWRPTNREIPLPPDITVGIKEAGDLTHQSPVTDHRTPAPEPHA